MTVRSAGLWLLWNVGRGTASSKEEEGTDSSIEGHFPTLAKKTFPKPW